MKNLKNLSRRGLALLLTLVMCLGMLQLTVFAIGDDLDNPDEIISDNLEEVTEPEVPATSDPEDEPEGEPADPEGAPEVEGEPEDEPAGEPENGDEAEDGNNEETVEPNADPKDEGEEEPTTPVVPEPEDDEDDKDEVVILDDDDEVPLNDNPFNPFGDDGPSIGDLDVQSFFDNRDDRRPSGGSTTTASGQDVYVFVNVAKGKITAAGEIPMPAEDVDKVKAAYNDAAAKVTAAETAKNNYKTALDNLAAENEEVQKQLDILNAEIKNLGELPDLPDKPVRESCDSWAEYYEKANEYNAIVAERENYLASAKRIEAAAEELLKNSNLQTLYNEAKEAEAAAQTAVDDAKNLAKQYTDAVDEYNGKVKAANQLYLSNTGDGDFFDNIDTDNVDAYNSGVDTYNKTHGVDDIVKKFNEDPYIKASNPVNNAGANIWYTIGKVTIDALTTRATGLTGDGGESFSDNGATHNDFYRWNLNTQTFQWQGKSATNGKYITNVSDVEAGLTSAIRDMMSNGNGRLGENQASWSDKVANLAGTHQWILKVSDGATGYDKLGTETVWHLDGYLYVQDLTKLKSSDDVDTTTLVLSPFGYEIPGFDSTDEIIPGEPVSNEPGKVKYTVEWLDKETKERIGQEFVTREGTDGDEVTVKDEDKQVDGYTFADDAQNILSGLLGKAGETVALKLYFTQNPGQYTVEYYKDGNLDGTDAENGKLTEGELAVVTEIDPSKYGKEYMLEKIVIGEETVKELPESVANGTTIKVYYAKDVLVDPAQDPDKDPNNGDGVPDKYQIQVTFKVVNGEWNKGGKDEIVTVATLMENSKYDVNGKATLTPPGVGQKPNEGYTAGSWGTTPPAIVTKENDNDTYIYTYVKDQIGYTVKYFYDGQEGNAPAGAPEGEKAEFGEYIDLSDTLKTDFSTVTVDGAKYLLEKDYAPFDVTISAEPEANIICVFYTEDVLSENGGNDGDGIPDKYQVVVTFKVKNGSWDATNESAASKDDITAVVTLRDDDGNPVKVGSATLENVSIPAVGSTPDSGYKASGSWDTVPTADSEIIKDTVFTYTYDPASSGSESTGSYTVTVNYVSDKGETVAPSQTSAAINQGSEYDVTDLANRTFEGWKYVRTDGAVSGTSNSDVTVNVIYTRDANNDNIADKYQIVVTFHVVNGDWNDGAEGAKVVYLTKLDANGEPAEDGTATLTADQFPAVGDKPASGYRASGSWSPAKAEVQLTDDAEYTFTYTRRSGGSSSRPSRPTTPDDTDPPVVDIPDEEPPLVDVPDVDTPVEPPVEPPVVDIPDEEPPLVDIPDEEPPLVDIPDEEPPLVDIPDEEPPLVDVPDVDNVEPPVVEIPENTVPLSDVPKTGDSSGIWTVLALLSAAGLLGLTVYGRKKREEV